MDIRTELVSKELADLIVRTLNKHLEFDLNEIANTTAITMLSEIQKVLQKTELSDFDMVEEIVCIFEDYNLDFGGTHDF